MTETVRGWLIIGPEKAAKMLRTSDALVGTTSTFFLPDAAECEPGRWIIWEPVPPTRPGPPVTAVTLVCVELPLPGVSDA